MLLGGFGFLGRLHGLSIDNLVEVEMVLADGHIVVVNENSYPGKSKTVFFSFCSFIFRSLVGGSRGWNNTGRRDSLQGQSIPSTSRLRGKPHLVCNSLLRLLNSN